MAIADEIRNVLLQKQAQLPIVMPGCADMLLSLVRPGSTPKDFVGFFEDYFAFSRLVVFPGRFPFGNADNQLDLRLAQCLTGNPQLTSTQIPPENYPPPTCVPRGCLTLFGTRYGLRTFFDRLFIADVIWLHYMERMGVFQILGAILDDYALKGALPIRSGTLAAVVLEVMVRLTKTGSSSTQRERVTAYRRALGWTTATGRALDLDSSVNGSFNNLFHKVLQSALALYRDRRVADVIGRSPTSMVSTATVTEIGETVRLLQLAYKPFDHGRVYQDTLVGIVWAVAAMLMIFELKDDIGIPSDYSTPEEFIPAAYDLLVAKRSTAPADANRYSVHRTLATYGRSIALDIEALLQPTTPVKDWLEDGATETKIEGYRTAYRNLTGIDLGGLGPTVKQEILVEQQV